MIQTRRRCFKRISGTLSSISDLIRNNLYEKKDYILLVLLALQACKHTQHRDQPLPEITINSFSEEAIPFSTLFDSLKYVTLKETEENFFGYITKLVANQQHLVFYDGMSNQIFIYNYEGHCQAKIHNQGRGEGEYIQITDIALDNEKQLIAVLDTWGKKILYYSKHFMPISG